MTGTVLFIEPAAFPVRNDIVNQNVVRMLGQKEVKHPSRVA